MKREIRHEISEKIREARIKKGLTQAALSEKSKIPYKYIQEIEGKNPPNMRVDTLCRLAESMEISAWTLLKGKKSK